MQIAGERQGAGSNTDATRTLHSFSDNPPSHRRFIPPDTGGGGKQCKGRCHVRHLPLHCAPPHRRGPSGGTSRPTSLGHSDHSHLLLVGWGHRSGEHVPLDLAGAGASPSPGRLTAPVSLELTDTSAGAGQGPGNAPTSS